MRKIAVYCEIVENNITNASLELISKAFELKEKSKKEFGEDFLIEGIVIAPELDNITKGKIYCAGAGKIVLIKDNSLSGFVSTNYSKLFVDYFIQSPSEIILFPASKKIRTLAPRIATMLQTGLVADCTELDLIKKDNLIKLAATRPTFGGELMATILCRKIPQLATVRPSTFKIKNYKNAMGEYFEFNTVKYDEPRLKLLRVLGSNAVKTNIEDAKIVLVGGYGLVLPNKNDEYFKKLFELASKINAQVGITRKVVDYGIMDSTLQIGQTGHTIKPELYISFGVSGAIQHVVGIKNSKTIIAINTDENAEIFKYADYKIVADAKKIIDDLLDKII